MFTGRSALQERAYADHGPLAARLSIYDYQQDRVDLPGVVLEALAAVRGAVVDAGCGLGTYVTRLRAERPELDRRAARPLGRRGRGRAHGPVRARVADEVARTGAWWVRNQVGVFTCRQRRVDVIISAQSAQRGAESHGCSTTKA